MRILIAEDELVPRCVLERTLREWGHEVVTGFDGLAAWEVFQGEDAPRLAILDWMMPGLDGPEVCRRARGLARREPTYCILLTARDGKADVAAGLEGGADDYITKPFDRQELRARVGWASGSWGCSAAWRIVSASLKPPWSRSSS